MSDRRHKAEPKDVAQRKREYDARQAKLGLRQFQFWLTENEARHLREELERLRGNGV